MDKNDILSKESQIALMKGFVMDEIEWQVVYGAQEKRLQQQEDFKQFAQSLTKFFFKEEAKNAFLYLWLWSQEISNTMRERCGHDSIPLSDELMVELSVCDIDHDEMACAIFEKMAQGSIMEELGKGDLLGCEGIAYDYYQLFLESTVESFPGEPEDVKRFLQAFFHEVWQKLISPQQGDENGGERQGIILP